MELVRIGLEDLPELAQRSTRSHHQDYLAMYSSVWGGVVDHPLLMTVPVDDHMVHRGDAVFEAFMCAGGNIYNFERHLDRLERSARAIFLHLPLSREELRRLVIGTIRSSGARDCLIRLFVSRGPGSFGVDPAECVGPQVYVIVQRLVVPEPAVYERGVKIKRSSIPYKRSYFANIKSCNYLANVLMQWEARAAGVDYAVSVDEDGFLGEGSTENIGVVTRERYLRLPRFAKILQGTTVTRAAELAEKLIATGDLRGLEFADVTISEAYAAGEILIFGTTLDVVAAVEFDGHPIGDGRPGPVAKKLRQLLIDDRRHNKEMQTPVYDPAD